MTLEECRELLDTVRSTGLTYMMAETSYYRRETILARQWYREGRFGEIFHTEGEYWHEHLDNLALRLPAHALPDPLDRLSGRRDRRAIDARSVYRVGRRQRDFKDQRLWQSLLERSRLFPDGSGTQLAYGGRLASGTPGGGALR